MKTERHTIQACCGRTAVILKTDRPLQPNIISYFVSLGFNESKHFSDAGIIYLDNEDFILTGPIGSDRLQVKCKKINCYDKIEDLENKLKDI